MPVMSLPTLSLNLLMLRTARSLTQEQVAIAAGISRIAYRNIESGTALPRAGTIECLAKALKVRIADLVAENHPLRSVRFRDRVGNKREEILVNVQRWLRNYCELETIMGEGNVFAFERGVGPATRKSPQALAQAARKAVHIDPGTPIRDICGLLEDNGVKVLPIEVASHDFFGISVGRPDGGPAVVINTWERLPVERWIFSAAHELGHLLMHLDAYEAQATESNEIEEREADLFAAQFLMPDEVFLNEWKDAYGLPFVDRVLKIKRIFHVSWKTVVYRLVQLGHLDDKAWAQFQSQYKSKHGRSVSRTEEPQGTKAGAFAGTMAATRAGNEPDQLSSSEFQEDRLQRLVRKALEEQKISLSRAAEILGRSMAQMRDLTRSWV
jgi:Zn-dependent peptidase ImmA (M78 family)/DNA-binding XRE family transcriptional regulator